MSGLHIGCESRMCDGCVQALELLERQLAEAQRRLAYPPNSNEGQVYTRLALQQIEQARAEELRQLKAALAEAQQQRDEAVAECERLIETDRCPERDINGECVAVNAAEQRAEQAEARGIYLYNQIPLSLHRAEMGGIIWAGEHCGVDWECEATEQAEAQLRHAVYCVSHAGCSECRAIQASLPAAQEVRRE